MRGLYSLVLVPCLALSAASRLPRIKGPVHTAKEAKAIAEQQTKGIAVSAKKIYLNGASCGWEVDVRMPNEERGWRCVVDCDTHMVFTEDRIPNPKPPKRKVHQ
jgi:hypothetical protein